MSDTSSASTVLSDKTCIICGLILNESNAALGTSDHWVVLTEKGIQSVREFSVLRGHHEITDYLQTLPASVSVHTDCRKKYTNKRHFEQEQQRAKVDYVAQPPTKSLRSSTVQFEWKTHCFFCSQLVIVGSRYCMKSSGSRVETMEIKENVLRLCRERDDAWGTLVSGRLHSCNDLVAEEARYHRACMQIFFNKRPPPLSVVLSQSQDPIASAGRPEDVVKMHYFNLLCDWLEVTCDQLYSITELHQIMQDLAGTHDEVYSCKRFQQLLFERYEGHLVVASVAGKNNVICFKDMASAVINDKWYSERQEKLEDESRRIVIAAAKLIRSQIREAEYDMDCYPKTESFKDIESAESWTPALVNLFMEHVVGPQVKRVAIAHSIVQAAKPRSAISPILFGIGVALDHAFGSKWALDLMSRLGFSSSYDEIYRFKQNVVQCDDSADMVGIFPEWFSQWSGDNVDHNVNTLDGSGSFHGMGVIMMSSKCIDLASGSFSETAVPRLGRIKSADVVKNRGIPVLSYTAPEKSALSLLVFSELHTDMSLPLALPHDVFWHTGWFLSTQDKPRANWSGFMQEITLPVTDFITAAEIRMLPLIDLNPNDSSCIYSTLRFVERQADRLNQKTACITFDQPLWLKATDIALSNNINVVCRLGGFHVIMSYIGAIGKIMDGSGLVQVLEMCFGPVAVGHMLTGKAVARAVRGLILVYSALWIMLLKPVLEGDHSEAAESSTQHHLTEMDIQNLQQLYSDVVAEGHNLSDEDEIYANFFVSCINQLVDVIQVRKAELQKASRTACLWLQYIDYVQVLLNFIRAERTCDWNLHLSSLSSMLNLFAASGHRHYAKSARLYLQIMGNLNETHPWLYEQLCQKKMHAVRRSDRFWAGLPTDLIIEQVLMRSIKSPGGLTHGRGMSEGVRLVWVKSIHRCAMIYSTLSQLTELQQGSSQELHHIEVSKSRIKRDSDDLNKMIAFFQLHNPFSTADARLRSIASGIAASEKDALTCDSAEVVGRQIMAKMDGQTYDSVVMKKKDQVKTLADVIDSPSGHSKKLSVDSVVLFSRLLLLIQRTDDMVAYFKYELTAYPSAIFKDGRSFRKTEKSALARFLDQKTQATSVNVDMKNTTCVVDGGWLLHKVKWQQGGVYGDCFQQYSDYIHRHYGSYVTVVFDGYGCLPTTKDQEHQRRSVKAALDILFSATTPVFHNQSAFLSNRNNKKVFVQMLIDYLRLAGFTVLQADSDADTLIVATALQIAQSGHSVAVIANDTDILVLLVYHFRESYADMYMVSEGSKQKSSVTKVRSIRLMATSIGPTVAQDILVIHAISGCDTTSALFGCGKASAYRKITAHDESHQHCTTLATDTSSREDILCAGLRLMVVLYGGKPSDSLDRLRYAMYMNMLATSSVPPRPERLPPTESSARFHIYRVHLQVVQWCSLMAVQKSPEEWGWRNIDNILIPITTNMDPAPAELLDIIKCKCKVDSTRKPCSSHLCSCVKNGLPCLAACKHCIGQLCENAQDINVLEIPDALDECYEEEPDLIINDTAASSELDEWLIWDLPWIDEEVVE